MMQFACSLDFKMKMGRQMKNKPDREYPAFTAMRSSNVTEMQVEYNCF